MPINKPLNVNNIMAAGLRVPEGIIDDPIQGCQVTAQSTPNMTINVAPGKYNNIPIQGGVLTVTHIQGADVPLTVTNKTISEGGNYWLPDPSVTVATWALNVDPNSIVVKDHTSQAVLTKNVGYIVQKYAYPYASGIYNAVLMGTPTGVGSKVVDITYNLKLSRSDMVVVNKTTGAISIVQGTETTFDLWTGIMTVPDGHYRLANIYIDPILGTIPSINIFNVQQYDQGLTAKEWFMMDLQKYQHATKLSRFYSAIESAQATSKPINIGILGDSVINGATIGANDQSGAHGWMAYFVQSLHAAYPNAAINYYMITNGTLARTLLSTVSYSAQNGSNLVFNITNYSQGSHSLFRLLHDNTNYYASNASGKYSVLYSNQVATQFDLFIIGRTNTCTYTTDLMNHADGGTGHTATYYSSGLYLHDIFQAAPYNLTLHAQADYSNATYGLNWLAEDNLKCYNAALQRIYTDINSKRVTGAANVFGADIVYLSGTPDVISNDGNGIYVEGTTYVVSGVRYQDIMTGQFARQNNCIYINFWDLFKNISTRLGLPLLTNTMAYAPDEDIHPNRIINQFLATVMAKIICPNF